MSDLNPCEPCRLCERLTRVRFNADFKLVPICEGCARAVTRQQIDWMCNKTLHTGQIEMKGDYDRE